MVPPEYQQGIMIKKFFFVAGLLVLAAGLVCGCSRKTGASASGFDQVAPEIKQAWDQAVTADKANDYFTAVTSYHTVMAQKDKLTEAQIETVNAACLAVNQRMFIAANNGDAAAKEASDKLVKTQH